MNYRPLGRTGWRISEISFGAWAIVGAWGNVDDHESLATLHAALDGGVNFFDTADVYGDGRSERLRARLKKERKEKFYIATKAGRRLPVQTTEGYNRKNLTAFVHRSLKNLNTDTIDLFNCIARLPRFIIILKCLEFSTTWSKKENFGTMASVWKKWRKHSKPL